MCATLHNHTLVRQGDRVAATRAIPLIMKRAPIERAAAIARDSGPVLQVKPLRQARVGLVITGNEVYHGLIQDRFAPILTAKVAALGSEISTLDFAPDDADRISLAIRSQLDRGCDLLLLHGQLPPYREVKKDLELAAALHRRGRLKLTPERSRAAGEIRGLLEKRHGRVVAS